MTSEYAVRPFIHHSNIQFIFSSAHTSCVRLVRMRHRYNQKAGWEIRQRLPGMNRPSGNRCVAETTDFKDEKFSLPARIEIA